MEVVTESCHDIDPILKKHIHVATPNTTYTFNHFKKSKNEILQNLKEAVSISRFKIKGNLGISIKLAEPR